MTWRNRAACKGAPTGLFYPEQGESMAEARRVCMGCPVQAECAEAGAGEWFGVWGGVGARTRIRQHRGETIRSGPVPGRPGPVPGRHWDDAEEISLRIANGEKSLDIAVEYGVSRSAIYNVLRSAA